MSGTDQTAAVRHLLEQWAETTRTGRLDEVLVNHAEGALIYDVLPPLKYEGAAAYRRSWGDWHPETVGEGQFGWQDLVITCDADLAFAHGLIVCGGAGPDGTVYSDTVRATFCLRRENGSWKVEHQHLSKPFTR
jgi:ketosteroid isomerase-like protein